MVDPTGHTVAAHTVAARTVAAARMAAAAVVVADHTVAREPNFARRTEVAAPRVAAGGCRTHRLDTSEEPEVQEELSAAGWDRWGLTRCPSLVVSSFVRQSQVTLTE